MTSSVSDVAVHSSLALEHPRPLKIAIVGAGIGGLSAAIGLRRAGHQVDIYELSRLATDVGAAVHLAPNSNGILRRWGIFAGEFGGTNMSYMTEFRHTGAVLKNIDLTMANKLWQHPWQLVHRVALHDRLKKEATSETGPGEPAKLHVSSKVVDVNPTTGTVTLENGTAVVADVLLGADGICSVTREHITGQDPPLFSCGKAAFRFLLPRSVALEDPVTKPLVEKLDCLIMWYGEDRRVVMYPCNDNQTLNFVCIHPDSESHASKSDHWNKSGSIEQLLKVYKDFDSSLKQLINKVDPKELKVWRLLDMEALPTFSNGKLAVLGDAAHPFTPHQGQGAGQAIEDAAALVVVLPRGTAPEDVPERLRLYTQIRYKRAHAIQEYSRQAGKDWVNGKPTVDMMAYTNHNFGHDEYDYASNYFKRWQWSKKPDLFWRMPIAFGPVPGPRQDFWEHSQPSQLETSFTTIHIKFKTSRTYLETLFPTASFSFKERHTVCEASFSVTTLDKMAWLRGSGSSHLGLYIHGVEYKKRDNTAINGTYMPVLFENLADFVVSGREELGMPKLFCDIDVSHSGSSYIVKASWRGATFLEISLVNLEADDPKTEHGTIDGTDDNAILVYRYIPAIGKRGTADAEYAVAVSHEEKREDIPARVRAVSSTKDASIKVSAGDWHSLPTIYHITSALAEIPIYGIVSAMVVEGTGDPTVNAARRIE